MPKMILKMLVRGLGRVFRVDIKRINPADINYTWLEREHIRTVFDIGANIGRFAKRIRKILPETKVYSFEPLESCYLKLISSMKDVSKFQAFNYALGQFDQDNVEMHHSQFSPSSSLLRMTNLHKQAFPYTNGETVEEVTMRRLDGVAQELDIKENTLVKIDVQGFEDKVIAGGAKTISKARVVIIETGFDELYKGQASFDGVYKTMGEMGFLFKGCWEQLKSPIDGSVLSCDAIFIKVAN